MFTLTNPKKTPPGGFRYQDSGKAFRSISHSAIMDEIARHRARYELDLSPGWQERVDTEMCEQNGWGGGICQDQLQEPHKISSGDVKNFLGILTGILASGGGLVDQTEAERRAAICSGCPKNIEVPGCMGMCPGSVARALMRFAAAFQGRRLETSHDADLRSCGVCGCANAAQVHVELESLKKVKGNFEYPSHCWKI